MFGFELCGLKVLICYSEAVWSQACAGAAYVSLPGRGVRAAGGPVRSNCSNDEQEWHRSGLPCEYPCLER